MICILVLYQALTNLYQEEEKALRSHIRKSLQDTFSAQTKDYSKTIGLFRYEPAPGTLHEKRGLQSSVVLVHGLDDPGKVWQNLAPVLAEEGYEVWLFEYPNDQPLADSAQLFFDELAWLRTSGIERIAMVAHSMGGLISRELLTSPKIAYHVFLAKKQVPEVKKLIMIGTPNHGSQLARLRIVSEIRDHLDRFFKGKATGLGFLLDGAGEAKIDLLPGSKFLTELNARSHPAGVEMLVIAGITAPWNEDDIDLWLGHTYGQAKAEQGSESERVRDLMESVSNGLGDGLVTLESARLDNIPLSTVKGTHLSMIRNISPDSDRIPPAVPLVVAELHKNNR